MRSRIVERLAQLHAEEPLQALAALNAVSGRVAPSSEERECFRLALDSLAEEGTVVVGGGRLRLARHAPQWEGEEGLARDKIVRRCRESGLAAPSLRELASDVRLSEEECQRVVNALVNAGELEMPAKGIYVHPEAMAECRAAVRGYLEKNGRMTVGQCRELLGASRKYLLPFLEQLDREGLTVRRGDYRVLARK